MNTDVNDNYAYLRVTTPTFGPKSQMTFLFQIDSHLSTTSGREEAHTGTHTCPDTFHVSAFEDKIRQEDTPVLLISWNLSVFMQNTCCRVLCNTE